MQGRLNLIGALKPKDVRVVVLKSIETMPKLREGKSLVALLPPRGCVEEGDDAGVDESHQVGRTTQLAHHRPR